MRVSRRVLVPVAVVLALVATACGSDDDDDDASGASGTTVAAATTTAAESELDGTLTVLAAASLTAAFEDLGARFESGNPNVDVEFSFAASSELATQIQEGAPADVFASADESNIQKVVDTGDTSGEPIVFAHNRLAIAVEKGNPQNVTGLADLANPDLIVVLCASEVPCGRYADEALASAGVSVTPKSRGESVKATLSVVELGEADAAIVYSTDVAASDAVDGVDIPDDENVIATLPIVGLTESGDPELAQAWIDYVTSDEAQQVLIDEYGFLAA